jgi:3-methyladenine DNA glycosylase AlkD
MSKPSGTDSRALEAALVGQRNPAKAALLQRFFKTGPGEYGHGDAFLGLTVPRVRTLLKPFRDLALPEVAKLLASRWHEVRLAAVVILATQADRADTQTLAELGEFYLSHSQRINNWDLVDVSAPRVVGRWLYAKKDVATMMRLARSKNVWERRIGVLASFWFIKQGSLAPSLTLAQQLAGDPEDLMHKAIGWMLREVGKKDLQTLRMFLEAHGHQLPRTALRYAIERFPEVERQRWLVQTKTPTRLPG